MRRPRGNVRTRWLRDARKTDQQRSGGRSARLRRGHQGAGRARGPVPGPRVSRFRRGGASGRGGRRVGGGRRHVGGLGDARGVSSEEAWTARAVRVGRRGALLPRSTPSAIHLLRCPRDACLPLIGFLIFI
ncbi:hypothetical protein GQ55_1G334600 [Panicum hallii var. hallii]|uniref:Uncharacterized protein n=1 Tax=Panicum hallii var. hallii TaxID=1504633 RepID=A0A2T7FA82_9POAL|nr:hypothetical protein GQ55_1G334600 [Panicum hallii var. hallii]